MKALSQRVQRLLSEAEKPRSESPQDLPAHVLAAVRAALDAGETHYVARPGLLELRQEIARAIERRGGPRYDPKTSVVVTAGQEEAVYVAFLALSREPGESPNVVVLGDALARPGAPLPPIPLDAIAVGSLDDLPGVASFRVGFVAGPEAAMRRVQTWKQALSICTAGPSQRAALAALRRMKE
jgi:aspartate/methionine/tyrosine aminotransferase